MNGYMLGLALFCTGLWWEGYRFESCAIMGIGFMVRQFIMDRQKKPKAEAVEQKQVETLKQTLESLKQQGTPTPPK